MIWWQNIPLFSIILSLLSAAVCSVLHRKAARTVCVSLLTLIFAASSWLIACTRQAGTSIRFMMGHFPAPWGNEIRFGVLEAVLASAFSLIFLFSVLGGGYRMAEQVAPDKENLFYVVCDLLEAALLAQIYSNDLFTSYVFVEIMTLAACSLITIRTKGKTLVSAMRYMILNLVGSGLFLLGVVLLYNMTGHLLMENIREKVSEMAASGLYRMPLTVTVGLLTVGLAVKSALFPFHTWVPDAYANGTPSSGAVLSSLVSKGYIVLLIKIYCRVLGMETVNYSGINNVLFLFAAGGVVMGSVDAVRAKQTGRMIAFSSVAQIGYIYLGIAMGTVSGFQAAVFQIIAHGFAKSLLFLSSDVLTRASAENLQLRGLKGAGYRAPLAGITYTVGAFSMIGLPMTGGFITKYLLIRESISHFAPVMGLMWGLMALSTFLNILYFMKSVVQIWTHGEASAKKSPGFGWMLAVLGLSAAVIGCFLFAAPLGSDLLEGIGNFA